MSTGAATIVAEWSGVTPLIPLLLAAVALALSLGYILWLKTHRKECVREKSPGPPAPAVDVIIADKLANVRSLRYPPDRLRFWIADGQSTDDTPRIVARLIKDDARCRLLRERPDKTAQLNAALARGAAPWVLVTDADSRMPPEILRTMVSAALSNESMGAVGAPIEPAEGCHWLERAHWRISNRVRALESRSGCASLVTGPCYLVRREAIGRIPGDVVADDIHAALASVRLGLDVCQVETPVTELRTPQSLPELFRHKLRKTTAYLREIFRFLPVCLRIPGPARGLFFWRAAQLIVLPWLVAAALVLLALSPSPVPAAALGLVVLGGAAVALLVSVGKEKEHGGAGLWAGLALAGFLLAVCLAAGVTYPFRRRSACYPKVGAGQHESQR